MSEVTRRRSVIGSALLASAAFLTASAPALAACPCSIWPSSAAPVTAAATTDTSPVEVGVKFRSQVAGKHHGPALLQGLDEHRHNLVPATVSYDGATTTATLNPTAPLAESTTYTATVRGGANGVKDVAANALVTDRSCSFTTAAPVGPGPDDGPGGPILVIAKSTNPFWRYYAEILRTEGLNEFTVKDIANVSAATLAGYDVAILGESASARRR